MEEPWSSVISNKTYGYGITDITHTYGVSPDWVGEVSCAVTRHSYDCKIML